MLSLLEKAALVLDIALLLVFFVPFIYSVPHWFFLIAGLIIAGGVKILGSLKSAKLWATSGRMISYTVFAIALGSSVGWFLNGSSFPQIMSVLLSEGGIFYTIGLYGLLFVPSSIVLHWFVAQMD